MQKYSKISEFLGGSDSKAQKGTAQSGSSNPPYPPNPPAPYKGGRGHAKRQWEQSLEKGVREAGLQNPPYPP